MQAEAKERFSTRMFGTKVTADYSENAAGYGIFALRIVMGWILFSAGVGKLVDPNWTAAGYLQHAVAAENPFAAYFGAMAGSPLIDGLVIWGLTLTGATIMLGLLLRWSAFWGAIIMVSFWASALPIASGTINYHILYAVLLFALGALGAGRIFGLDQKLEASEIVKKKPWLGYLLG